MPDSIAKYDMPLAKVWQNCRIFAMIQIWHAASLGLSGRLICMLLTKYSSEVVISFKCRILN